VAFPQLRLLEPGRHSLARRGAPSSSFPHCFFLLLPSPQRRSRAKGQNPKWISGWPAKAWLQGVGARSRRCKGKELRPELPWAGLATWPAPNGRYRAYHVTGRDKRGTSLSRFPWGGSRARTQTRRACQLGTRPSHPRARSWREPAGAVRSEE
jgi:hypothetical protein